MSPGCGAARAHEDHRS